MDRRTDEWTNGTDENYIPLQYAEDIIRQHFNIPIFLKKGLKIVSECQLGPSLVLYLP